MIEPTTFQISACYKQERFELTGKEEITMGALDDFDFLLGFSGDFLASLLEKQDIKHLKMVDKNPIRKGDVIAN